MSATTCSSVSNHGFQEQTAQNGKNQTDPLSACYTTTMPTLPLFADVLIEDLPAHIAQDIFTYAIPTAFQAQIVLGQQVIVPLGTRRQTGFVIKLHSRAPGFNIRPLERLFPEPLFEAVYLRWLHWVAQYYVSSLSQVLGTALPRQLTGRIRRELIPLSDPASFVQTLESRFGTSHPEWVDFGKYLISSAPSWKSVNTCKRQFGSAFAAYSEALQTAGLIAIEERIEPRAQPRLRQEVQFRSEPTGLSLRQASVLRQLRAAGGRLTLKDLCQLANTQVALIQKLAARGAVEIVQVRERRIPLASRSGAQSQTRPPLTAAQQAALDRILACLAQPPHPEPALLLHGVTGSGKTEVYMHAMAEVLRQGGTCLFLLPEIALTPLMLERLRGFFGDQVALLHSGLSAGEYLDEWERIRDGEAPVVVGARSAIFAPLRRLRLIVIDEEHESSYKQDNGLRYDARTLALGRAWLSGGLVILGSATPRLETWHKAQQGQYPCLSLPERIQARPLPPVSVIDMRTIFADDKGSVFSPALRLALAEALDRQEQAVLLLNRRGYSASVLCRSCGQGVECPLCAIGLTYHRSDDRLKCHYCDYQSGMPERCPACQSTAFHRFGLGTQKLEELTRQFFPAARTVRMDRDTTRTREAHLELLDRFASGEANVLIGTQMVAKGLDFPRITVVGLLMADLALNLPDFRAAERTFQLLTQAAGRGGRGELPARVFLQTWAPEHMAIRHAVQHDFAGFAREELHTRQELHYPPFGHLVRIVMAHPREQSAHQAAEALAAELRASLPPEVILLGPAAAAIARIRSLFLVQMLLKTQNLKALRPVLKQVGRRWQREVQRLVIDIDPYTML
jgi:primosomal protein N' (replication factor Y)